MASIPNPIGNELPEMKLSYYTKCNNCCSVPDCVIARDFYQYPFCKYHAPKCHCGAPAHIIFNSYQYNLAYKSKDKLDALIRLYDLKCHSCYKEFMKTAVFGSTRASRIKCNVGYCSQNVKLICVKMISTSCYDQDLSSKSLKIEKKWLLQFKCDSCAPKCACGEPCQSRFQTHKGYYPDCFACRDFKSKPGAQAVSPLVEAQMTLMFGSFSLF